MTHAHRSGARTLSRPLNTRRMEDRAALDAVSNVLATTDLDAVALGKITDLVRGTGRTVIDRDDDPRETFCSNCGPLDTPGVHTQPDCPRYRESDADGHPTVSTDTDGPATVPAFLDGVLV